MAPRPHVGRLPDPQWLSLGIMAITGLSMMAVAIAEFRKTEQRASD
jgi:hypothetical protein